MDYDSRRRKRREAYLLDSVGGSGVQSGTLPVPSSVNNQSESAKEKVCHNNNNIVVVDSTSPAKKSGKTKQQQQQSPSQQPEDSNKILEDGTENKEASKKDPDEKEDFQESGIECDGDNVMQVRAFGPFDTI